MDLAASAYRASRMGKWLVQRFRRWQMERHEAERLRILLDKRDAWLLEDVGISRETGHHLLGEKPFFHGREWDRWQL